MSYADYCRHRVDYVTCRHCGWHGREGEECDCEEMEEAARIEARLREGEEGDDE